MSKKRLTFKQISQKAELLQKTRNEIKGHTAKEITHIWEKYRTKKYVIEELPKYKALKKAHPEKAELYKERYYDRKDIAARKLEFGNLQIEKRVRKTFSESDYYKLRKGNLDNTIDKIFEVKKPRYVLVTLKLKSEELDHYTFFSDSFTIEAWNRTKEQGKTAMERLNEKLEALAEKYPEDLNLISVHVRTVYSNENPKPHKRQKGNRKVKK